MAHLHQCPNCLYAFVDRKFDWDQARLGCRRCTVQIVHVGERHTPEDKMFLCVSKGDERAIRPWNPISESWGELIDWEDKKYSNFNLEWDGEKLAERW